MTDRTHTTALLALAFALVAAPVAPAAGAPAPAPSTASTATDAAAGAAPAATHGGPADGVAPRTDAANGTTPDGNASTTNLTAGESLSGAIAAHDAELEGEVESRALANRLAVATFRANTSRAAVLADEVARARLRLATLAERRQRLRTAYRNGTISEGQYRVRLARLAVESRTLGRTLARVDAEFDRLPAEELDEPGLNRSEVVALYLDSGRLTDREASDLLDSVGGPEAFGPDATTPFDPALTDADSDLVAGNLTDPEGYDLPSVNRTTTLPDGFEESYTVFGENYTAFEENYAVLDGNYTVSDRDTSRLSERRQALYELEQNRSSLGEYRRTLVEFAEDDDADMDDLLRCGRDRLRTADAHIADAREALQASNRTAVDDALAETRDTLSEARRCLDEAERRLHDDGDDTSDGDSTDDGDWETSTPTKEGGT